MQLTDARYDVFPSQTDMCCMLQQVNRDSNRTALSGRRSIVIENRCRNFLTIIKTIFCCLSSQSRSDLKFHCFWHTNRHINVNIVVVISEAVIMYSTRVQADTVQSLILYLIINLPAAEWYTHRFHSVD